MNKRTSNIQSLWLSLSLASTAEFNKRFEQLFERLKPSLEYLFLVKCQQSKEETQDLIMITAQRVVEKLPQYDPANGMFSTWVFTLARNIVIDHVRKHQKKSNLTLSMNAPVTLDDGEELMLSNIQNDDLGPLDVLERKESHARLHQCIDQLKPQTKQVLVMFYLEQLKMVEIAEKLNIGINSVKILLFRARATLAKAY